MAKDSNSRNNLWKWLILLLIAVGSAYLTFPVKDVVDDAGNVVQPGKIRLGLDLKGGSSFTLEVDNEKLDQMILDGNPDLAKLEAEEQAKALATERKARLSGLNFEDRVVEVIRRRVDAMGTNEPVIQPSTSGSDEPRIIVQLPGADKKTQDAARDRLQKMAHLAFHIVPEKEDELVKKLLDDPEYKDKAPRGYRREGNVFLADESTEGDLTAPTVANFGRDVDYGDLVDVPVRFIFERQKGVNGGRTIYRPHFINRRAGFTGDGLQSARVTMGDGMVGGYAVSFEVKPGDSVEKFSALTGENVGRQMAIVLDDEQISAPVLQSRISDHGQITGNFTASEAKRLASDLNAGALPVPLKLGAESSVDPTVGTDAIARGKWAALIGFALVAVFMLFYYWYLGAVADVALLLDVLLLPAALFVVANLMGTFVNDPTMDGGKFQLPVLTMPGIAGLILTLGMAVDANVLIFERIREEFGHGADVGTAIEHGYGRAFTAIFDSNITTIITGCILYAVGTGPVRGFAIMLTGGVIISMFTAIVVTRLIIERTSDPTSGKPFKMRHFFKETNIDFMKYGRKALIASVALVVVLLGVFFYRLSTDKTAVLAVDLTGGTAITYTVRGETTDAGAIRDALEKIDNAIQIQFLGSSGADGSKLLIKTGISEEGVNKKIDAALAEKFGEKTTFTEPSVEMVGSTVGVDLRESGTKAVLFSLIAILIYVGFRFKFGFGLGGIIALAHDALIALGLYSILGHQVSLIVITALLTIIGYSINDTVVVFDRIREILKHDKRISFYDACNKAINSCLSRTVITSLTTFFAVLALFFFGEGSIYDFALTMLIGVVAGTYSSIFVATPVMAWWYKMKRPDLDDEENKVPAKA